MARLLRYKDSLEKEITTLRADQANQNQLQILPEISDGETRAVKAEQELLTFKEYATHLELENDESKLILQENVRLQSVS